MRSIRMQRSINPNQFAAFDKGDEITQNLPRTVFLMVGGRNFLKLSHLLSASILERMKFLDLTPSDGFIQCGQQHSALGTRVIG